MIILIFALHASIAHAIDFNFEKDNSLPLAQIDIAIKGGSAADPVGKNGVTYLYLHMLARGTQTKTKSQLDLALDQLGASINVSVYSEISVLHASVLSKNVKQFLLLLNEILAHPSFRMSELESLKNETISGILHEYSSDEGLAAARAEQMFFGTHPYARRPNGRIADLKRVQMADVVKAYDTQMRDSNIVLLISGDMEEGEARDFSKMLAQSRPGSFSSPEVPEISPQAKTRVAIVNKPDRTQFQIVIAQKGVRMNDPRLDALKVANYIFGGDTFTTRLITDLRIKHGWTYSARSDFRLSKQPRTWFISFSAKNQVAPAAVTEALKLLEEFKTNGITEKEFEFAKRAIVNSSDFIDDTPEKRLDNRLTEIVYGLPKNYFDEMPERIEELKLDDVNKVIQDFFSTDHLLFVALGTASTISHSALAKATKVPESAIEIVDYKVEQFK